MTEEEVRDYVSRHEDLKLNINYRYASNPDYEYVAYLERINFDEEKEKDLRSGKGFIIKSPKSSLKKDIKNPEGIYSTVFGQRLGDQNPYMDRFSCLCGKKKGAANNGIWCPDCQSFCKFVDDDFSIFGWIELVPEYAIINPDMYKSLDTFFGASKYPKDRKSKRGSVLYNMLDFDKEIDSSGNIIGYKEKANEPFYGIGMIEFRQRFDEIFEYYYAKNKKREIYEDIMYDRDKLFINSIPVYTTLLRPMEVNNGKMTFEKTNEYFNMMSKLANFVNRNKRKIDRNEHSKNLGLFKLQQKYMDLYDEVVAIMSGKKGELRNLVAGRFNFTSRSVIRQNPNLRIDQVELPYTALVIILGPRIMNVLRRTLNISVQEARDKWFNAIDKPDKTIVGIIQSLIDSSPEGLPILINRNPTINYGSIIQVFCIGINFNFTMSMPLQILVPLAADFDGDTLNIMFIINDAFYERAYEVFNPRNAMYISRSNGKVNKQVMPQKDTMIATNTLNYITIDEYSEEEINNIRRLQAKCA